MEAYLENWKGNVKKCKRLRAFERTVTAENTEEFPRKGTVFSVVKVFPEAGQDRLSFRDGLWLRLRPVRLAEHGGLPAARLPVSTWYVLH
jgi:hypothetical protein